jgi:RNA polymerase sigma-70 factor (ECF subfamily)
MHEERVIGAAYGFLGNWEDARDVAQEAFVKAYENLSSFRQESKFYTWLYRIAANLSKDFLRKKKLRRWMGLASVPVDEENDPVLTLPGRDADSLKQMENKELGGEIDKALQKLPMQQRTAFTLRYFEGLSLEEIGQVMGITTGAAKATLWQAGQKMKRELQDYAS